MKPVRCWPVTLLALSLLLALAAPGQAQVGANATTPAPGATVKAKAKKPARPDPAAAPARSGAAAPSASAPAAAASANERSGTDQQPFSFKIEPAPAWVVPAAEAGNKSLEAHSMHYRVIDDQILVDAASTWSYGHVVRVVDTAAGLATAAQIELEFDPAYQTFTLHHLRVLRSGQAIDKADRRRIQLLQRETQLERRMYDGRVTFSVVLDDVRVGDEIDFAYSVRGANPVFGGKFVANEYLASFRGPVAVQQLRILAPADRTINATLGPTDTTTSSRLIGQQRETVYRREAVARISPENNTPATAMLAHMVQLSEFADWAEVARWGSALFANAEGGARTQAVADQIAASTPDKQARVLAALAFVQKEVRYFGTELGSSSHQPAPSDRVVEQRFGDCKDKVALLVALLRRLDVSATPVLVSSINRSHVTAMLASPLAFDHVIARIDLEGGPYWIDATRAQQTGLLANRQAVDFNQGLALEAASTGIGALPQGFDAVRQVVDDTLQFDSIAGEPTLVSRMTFRGAGAEMVRSAIANSGPATLQTNLAAPYVKAYPKLRSTGSLQVFDSVDDDAVTLVQTFKIAEFWRFPEERVLTGDVVQWSVIEALIVPRQEARRDPYGIAYPGIYRHKVTLEFPEDVSSKPFNQSFNEGDRHFTLSGTLDGSARKIVFSATGRIGVERVEAAAWPAYTAKLMPQLNKLGSAATVPALSLARLDTLRTELKSTDEAVAARRLKFATRGQFEAHVRTMVLTAQIESGRLPAALEGQARTARGIQYDHLGRYKDARADFMRALELAPEAPATWNAAAVNALQMREFDRAVELTGRALTRNPQDSEARNTLALVRYLQKDTPAARTELTELLKDASAVRRGYPLVLLSLAMRQGGQDVAELKTRYPADALPNDWPRPLIDQALGQLSSDAAIEAARKSTTQQQQQLCEAYFYLAERYLVDGDRKRAIEYWRKTVDTGVTEFIEFGVAKQRLAEFAPG